MKQQMLLDLRTTGSDSRPRGPKESDRLSPPKLSSEECRRLDRLAIELAGQEKISFSVAWDLVSTRFPCG